MRRRGKSRTDFVRDLAIIGSGRHWLAVALALSLLALLPFVLRWTHNLNWLTFLNFTLLTVIAVLGLNITTGMAGQLSLGHAAFVLAGGYALGVFTVKLGWPFWGALPVATLLSGIAGFLVGIPALRLRGFYVAVTTLAFFYIIQFVVRNIEITGGIHGLIGIPYPYVGGLAIKSDIRWYFLLLVFCVLCILASVNLTRSRLGRAFLAIRDNEDAAANLGISVGLAKLRAFFIGALFGGLAGALWASYVSVVKLDQFTIWDSIWYLGMMVIGGAGSTAGTVLGVIALRLTSQVLHSIGSSGLIPLSSNLTIYMTYAIFGIAIILFISFRPFGLIAMWQKLKANYKRWPFGT
ncbi:MAG: branched-chain amino acid ABC transporter permease [Chloroflexi bacterium]|nr:branched-chain amino acid ABC transporter permease [Chloroflexota bacterium]